MKRIATIGAVITAFAIAPSVASAGGGNFAAQVKPQFKAQVIGAQVASVQRVQAAISVQGIASSLRRPRSGRSSLHRFA